MKHAMNSLKHWHGSLHPCQAMLGHQQHHVSYARTEAAAREGKKDWGNCVEQVCKAEKPAALESGLWAKPLTKTMEEKKMRIVGRAVSQNLNQLIVITLKFDYPALDLNNFGIGFLSCDLMFCFDNTKKQHAYVALYNSAIPLQFPMFFCPILWPSLVYDCQEEFQWFIPTKKKYIQKLLSLLVHLLAITR